MNTKLFNLTSDLICIANNEGYFLDVNPAFMNTLGYSKEELLSKPYLDFVHPDDKDKTINTARYQETGGDVRDFENRYLCKDGSYRILSWNSSVDEEEGVIYAIARDVTQYREKEYQLNQINNALYGHSIFAATDKEGVITEVNDEFCRISGYSREELIGQTHQIINSGKHSDAFWKELWETISSGRTWSGVIQNKAKNGDYYFVHSIITPTLDSHGEVDGYVAIRFEITKEIYLQKDLNRIFRILNETNAIAKVGGWELIVETGELNWTDETFKILEVEKKHDQKPMLPEGLELFIPEHKPIIDEAVKRGIEFGEPYSLELQAQTAKGNVLWVYTNGRAHYKNGKVVKLSGTIQDIDEKKKAEMALEKERAISAQNAKLATLGELSAGVAHEINNPLAIAMGCLSMLEKNKDDPEKYNKKLGLIEKSCKRIQKITKGMLKFSRQGDKEIKPISIATIVDEAVSLAQLKAKKFSIRLESQVSSKTNILCNDIEVEQVIINLVNNAIDAIKDMDERWVNVEAIDSEGFVIVKVIDSGGGLSPEIAEKLFDPFYTTKELGEGTGLGLSISKGILEEHNSTIHIDHNCVNTCFVLKFPAYNT